MKRTIFWQLFLLALFFLPLQSATPPIVNINILNAGSAYLGDSALAYVGKALASGYATLNPLQNIKSAALWVERHPVKVCIYGSACGYGALQYRLSRLNSILLSETCWSLWHNESSIEQLYALGQDTLGDLLLKDIQKSYLDVSKPTDFIQPLAKFIRDVDHEQKMLTEYQKLFRWALIIHIESFCMFNADIIAQLDNRIKRLTYIKQSFLNWLANFNLANH
jgi:hypothetical protein